MPDIVFKLLHAAMRSSCADHFESEQTPFPVNVMGHCNLGPGYHIWPVVVTVCHNRHNGVPTIYCGCFSLFPVVFSYQEASGLTIRTTISAFCRDLQLIL